MSHSLLYTRAAIFLCTFWAGAVCGHGQIPEHVVASERADISTSLHGPLRFLGRYESGVYRESASEIVAYEPTAKRAFVVNASSGKVDVLDMKQLSKPQWLFAIDVSDIGSDANSVAVSQTVVAIAVQAKVKTDPGFVAIYGTDGERQAVLQVGALPDAVTFSPDGRYLLVANEGEPNDDYSIDPPGSVSIIDFSVGLDSLSVKTADFNAFDARVDELREAGVRIFGPGASVSQDVEPEWIDISSDSRTAYVSLQENNAIAVVDIADAVVQQILPLGYKDWSTLGRWAGRGFDGSDRDAGITQRNWPVFGMFQPDTVKVLEVGGETFLIGACEGDARPWGEPEEVRVGELTLDPIVFPNAAWLQAEENLGRLFVTRHLGIAPDVLGRNERNSASANVMHNRLFSFGGRSMAIWKVNAESLELVFDTGSQIEETIAERYPEYFNADHEDRSRQLDRRSPSKGAEPEGLALGNFDGRTYAFVGLERIGGIMVYDVSVPTETRLIQYLNTRDFSISQDADAAHTKTDLGPEGLCFVPASSSPDAEGRPLLIVGHEASGTTSVFALEHSR